MKSCGAGKSEGRNEAKQNKKLGRRAQRQNMDVNKGEEIGWTKEKRMKNEEVNEVKKDGKLKKKGGKRMGERRRKME